MKKLNVLLDKLNREYPRVSRELKHYGEGQIVQVIMSSVDDPYMSKKIKDKTKTGITINNQEDFEIIEVLYTDNKQKKECEKELYNILVETIKDKIVYVSVVSQEKESLLIQLFIMKEVKSIEI